MTKLCACSSCVPCEKFRRATSIPACINLRIMRGVRVDGPMVQTIFEWREFIAATLSYCNTEQRTVASARDRNFRDEACEHINALGERGKWQPFLISMNSPLILSGHRNGAKAIGLNTMQPQLRGVRGAGGHEG